jgi:very-short-patch-repair endonuclease
LRGASWKRISYGHYVWAGLQESPELVLADVHRRLPPKAAFSGRTAAWLHGLDFPPCDPIEATFLIRCGTTTLTGVAVHRTSLPDADLIVRSGLPTTSALRTVFDLGSRPPLVEAVGAVDMALRAGVVNLADIRQWADEHSGARGIRQFRRVVELAEPLAESPMETRLRMLLVLARLPRPEAQVSLNDSNGRFLGRVDLYYPAERLALEYDGGTHRTSLIDDNRRQNLLLNAGYHVLRFTVADIRETSDAVVRQVRAALGMKSKRRAALRRQAQ